MKKREWISNFIWSCDILFSMINIQSIFQEIIKHKKVLLLANSVAILSTLVVLPVALLLPLLIDEIILGKGGLITETIDKYFTVGEPMYYILIVLLVTMGLKAVGLLFSLLHIRLFTKISKEVTYTIRKRLLNHLQVVSMREYDLLGSGAVSSKIITDVETVDKFVASSVGEVVVEVLTLIGVSIVLLILNWQLALVILLLNPITIFVFLRAFRNVAKMKKRENESIETFQNTLTESLELYNQIRVQNREKHFLETVDTQAKEIRDRSYLFGLKSEVALEFSRLLVFYSHDIFKAIGIFMVLIGMLTIGKMLAIFSYAWVLMRPVDKLINFIHLYFNAKSSIARLNEILELEKEPQYEEKVNPFENRTSASIRLKDVSFSYDGSTEVLKNINIEIQEGEKVAIVGETGSGKSTLAQILIGLYPISSGEIFYNEHEIKEVGYEKIRENVGFVLQAPLMFNDSLRFNLTLGRAYSDELIYEALKVAQLFDFVNGLENKLDTIVGKNGTKLSGGQRQRLSIARVLLDNPKVIIFDESTSSLDTETETKLLKALDKYVKDKTVITIAHRKSSIERADRVIDINML
ncbi:MAG: Lipid A export ATP-binding/permease protein MsbA [uncultured Sulfurovum sp.]|uniref:Lipid A export ATP-binding/permease protein MsbA n=1 Tax=uncultured Sulfurovum sp. TaxID=269237 RepID=A0A6S6T736_9BACT|nr:MAG: Lipid A export ATP-binding/permease protein MsbA [uncultured Sulfurovum sp.]